MIWLWRGPQLSQNSLFLWCKQFQWGFWIKRCPSTCGDNTLKQNYVFRDTNKNQLNHTWAETVWNPIWEAMLSPTSVNRSWVFHRPFMGPVNAVSWVTWFNSTALIRPNSNLLRTLCHTHYLLASAYTHTPYWLTTQVTQKQGGQMTLVRPLNRT